MATGFDPRGPPGEASLEEHWPSAFPTFEFERATACPQSRQRASRTQTMTHRRHMHIDIAKKTCETRMIELPRPGPRPTEIQVLVFATLLRHGSTRLFLLYSGERLRLALFDLVGEAVCRQGGTVSVSKTIRKGGHHCGKDGQLAARLDQCRRHRRRMDIPE